MIGSIVKLLKVLNSETGPWQLAFGVSLGMILGLTPMMSMHNLIVLLLVLWCRVNLSLFLLSFGIFSGFAYILDPLFHQTGYSVLNALSMIPLWTEWYNEALMRWTRFNNTVVMGSFVVSLLLFIPMTLLARFGVRFYRQRWQKRLENSSLMKWLNTTRWTQALMRIGDG